MEAKKPEKTNENKSPSVEKKEYEKILNGRVPIQQAEIYRKPSENVIEDAVKELNPDRNSMESRG